MILHENCVCEEALSNEGKDTRHKTKERRKWEGIYQEMRGIGDEDLHQGYAVFIYCELLAHTHRLTVFPNHLCDST